MESKNGLGAIHGSLAAVEAVAMHPLCFNLHDNVWAAVTNCNIFKRMVFLWHFQHCNRGRLSSAKLIIQASLWPSYAQVRSI